jgi:hypothetical protein
LGNGFRFSSPNNGLTSAGADGGQRGDEPPRLSAGRWTDVRGVASATEDLQLAELHYVTGETIVPGDIAQYHGDRGEVVCVVSDLTGDPQNDWHFRTNGPGVDGARTNAFWAGLHQRSRGRRGSGLCVKGISRHRLEMPLANRRPDRVADAQPTQVRARRPTAHAPDGARRIVKRRW